jgi:hypothetical protein
MPAVPIDRITPPLYNDADQVKGTGRALEGRSAEGYALKLGLAVDHGLAKVNIMTPDYETVLEQARRLSPEEQHRLREEIVMDPNPSIEGLGAQFVAYLKTVPFDDVDRADLDAMKQAIEEGCEHVDSDTW